MKRPLFAALLAVLPAVGALPQTTGQQPTFPTQAEVVTVDIVVTDRAGAPVLDLRREDFAVSEDGDAQEIVAFEAVHRPAPGEPSSAPRAPEPRSSSNQEPWRREASHFVIVFDELHMDPAEAPRAKAAVGEFLEKSVGERDRVALVGTAEGTRFTARLPEGREALRQALERLQGRRLVGITVRDWMSDYEAMRIDRDRDPIVTDSVMRRFLETGEIRQDTASPGNPVDQGAEVPGWRSQVQSYAAQAYARATARNEQTLGVVERSLSALTAARGRKSLVFVSGGLIQDPRLSIYREVVTEARRANAAVYFLDARGLSAATAGMQAEVGTRTEFRDLGAWFTETRERSEGSEGLAADTGGFSLRNRNDLAAGLERISRESRSYYLLGYTPTNRRADGRFREIGVKVAREGVTVRARRGYYAPGGDGKREAPTEKRDAAIQRALDAPFDLTEVPLRAIVYVFEEAPPGQVVVRLTVEADIRAFAFAEDGGTARDTLEFLLLVAREDTGEFSRFDQQFEMSLRPETRSRYEREWFPITRELKLTPGRYQARIVARDRNRGRVGSLTHEFEVPDVSGLRVSSLTLSDRLREEAKTGARAPELTARRRFAPSGILHCRFEVYGAARDPSTGRPNVTAGLAVRRADGRILVGMEETPLRPGPDGALSRALGVPLDGAPPGTYEMIVVVTDLVTGRSAEAREPFVVEEAAGG